MAIYGFYYDGQNAQRRDVTVEPRGSQFILAQDGHAHGPFAFADLHYVGERRDGLVFGLTLRDGWRLVLDDAAVDALGPLLPDRERYGRIIDRLGLGPATIAFTIASAIVLTIVLTVPQWLAPLVPYSVERRLGDAMIGDFGGRICHGAAGEAALKKLTARLDDNPEGLDIAVVKIPFVNAIALPGGKVLIFDGLLAKAKSPDEVAGVLAHEIGHVRERHVLQGLMRQLGLSVLMGGFNGNVGGAVNGLLSLSYTRKAEESADRFSIGALHKARISPRDTAAFFSRMSAASGDSKDAGLMGYLATHPHSADRQHAYAQSQRAGITYRPALSPQEWRDLKSLCAKDKNAKAGLDLSGE